MRTGLIENNVVKQVWCFPKSEVLGKYPTLDATKLVEWNGPLTAGMLYNPNEDTFLARPKLISKEQVKEEAGARILSRYPIHKQINMQSRESELVRKGEVNWTPGEAAEMEGIQLMRDWINSVRAVSNELEQMNPIPTNYKEYEGWPE